MERSSIGSPENPFGVAPNSGRFYSNPHYERACDTVLNGIRERRGLILLIGEPGTGKTTLIQQTIGRLDKQAHSVLFCSFHPALDETLNSLCQHLGLSVVRRPRQHKVEQLNQALSTRTREGKNTAFVVDDAHTLDASTLTQILSLAQPTETAEHLLQIVLVGLPELEEKLYSTACRRSLPTTRFPSIEVRALPLSEVPPFIEHQLEILEYEPRRFFTLQAMQRIATHSKGIPREINALCGLAWVVANLESSPAITAEMVEEIQGERALWAVGIDAETPRPARQSVAETQALSPSSTPWFSFHPHPYPPQQQLEAVNDSDAGDTDDQQDSSLSQTFTADEDKTACDATAAQSVKTTPVTGQPPAEPLPEPERWVPSWRLTGSTVAFSVLFLTGVVFWKQLPPSDYAARPNALDLVPTGIHQGSPEAEIEFAQMRPLITGQPVAAPDTRKATDDIAPQHATGQVQEGALDGPVSTGSEPMVARSRPAAANAVGKPVPDSHGAAIPVPALAEPSETDLPPPSPTASVNRPSEVTTDPTLATPPAAVKSPNIQVPIEPVENPGIASATVRSASKPKPSMPADSDSAGKTVAHVKPSSALPSSTTPGTSQDTSPPLPSILGALDRSGYRSMDNEVMGQVTAQMLPVDPKQIDLPGFHRFLSEERSPNSTSTLSGPAALGAPALPLNTGSFPVFSGR
ncbi:MAG: AAA family ATPase [Gammaproteobacteria bacterium]